MSEAIFFNGSDGYLVANANSGSFGTSDFTVEAFLKLKDVSGIQCVLNNYNVYNANSFGLFAPHTSATNKYSVGLGSTGFPNLSSSTRPNVKTFDHVAVTRRSNTFTLFVNGMVESVATFTGNLTHSFSNTWIGNDASSTSRYYEGWINGLRITKNESLYNIETTIPSAQLPNTAETDTYYSNTYILLHGNGTNGSNSILNNGNGNVTIAVFGNTSLNTAQVKFGNASIYFDGSSDYITLQDQSSANIQNLNDSSKDVTFEAWVYPANLTSWQFSTTQPIFFGHMTPTAGTSNWAFGPVADGTVTFRYWNGGAVVISSPDKILANQWSHIAFTKTTNGITIWVNGVGYGPVAISGTIATTTANLTIGKCDTAGGINGYVDDLRYTYGAARYVYPGFTPPTTLSLTPNTTLLTANALALNANNYCIDQSNLGYSITTFGDVGKANDGVLLNITNTANILLTMNNAPEYVFANTILYEIKNDNNNLIEFYSGSGTITGSLKKKVITQRIPIQTDLFLYAQKEKLLIDKTTSNSSGYFSFTNLNKDEKFYIVAFDPVLERNAVILDNLTPD